MPSFQKPKGVRTLPTSDWFYHNSAAGSGITNSGPADWVVALFNNDQTRWLWVYAISASAGTNQYAYYRQVLGTPGLNFFGNCFPVATLDPLPPGQIFTGNVVSIFPPGPFVSFPIIPMNLGNDGVGNVSSWGIVRSQWPLAVLQPGYSLWVQAQGSCIANFEYLFMGP